MNEKTGLFYENGVQICLGDKVVFITDEIGKIVYECGAFGIAFDNCIDYEKIQEKMDELELSCNSRRYSGCENDNFISLWEIYWNFSCEEDTVYIIHEVETK